MTDHDILDILNPVFRHVLENDSIVLTPRSTPDDVDGWDSMNHIFIVAELEKRLGLKFQATEMEALKDVGQLTVLLRGKLGQAG